MGRSKNEFPGREEHEEPEGSGEVRDLLEAAAAGQEPGELSSEASMELEELQLVLEGIPWSETRREEDEDGIWDEQADGSLPALEPPEEQEGRRNISIRHTAWHAQVKGGGIKVLRSQRWASIPDEGNLPPQISQAAPIEIHPIEVPERPDDTGDIERIIFVPDIQAWFWEIDGVLYATHSEPAIDVMLQVVQDVQPHKIVLLGDVLDFSTLGKFTTPRGMRRGLQPTINYGHALLGMMRANAPEAEIIFIEGNHDKRLSTYVDENASDLYDLRRAGSDERMLSVPYVLNFERIGNITYVPGWPSGELYLSDHLRVIHGAFTRGTRRSTVAAIARDADVSTVSAHTHRRERFEITRQTRYGAQLIIATSFGMLGNNDGSIPGRGWAVDLEGRPVRRVAQAQIGFGYGELWRDTGRVACIEQIAIDDNNTEDPYVTRFHGKTYRPSRKQVEVERVS